MLADLQATLRYLRRHPTFGALTVLALALAIGPTAVVASAVYGLLLRPLPFPGGDRIVLVQETSPPGQRGVSRVSIPNYLDWRQARSLDDLAAYRFTRSNLRTADGAEAVSVIHTTANLLDLFAYRPQVGRVLSAADGAPDAPRVALLSWNLWNRRFASDPDVVGAPLVLDDRAHTVVGILPPGAEWENADLWVPLPLDPAVPRDQRDLRVLGRVAAGQSLATARSELETLADELARRHPETNAGAGVVLRPLRDSLVGRARTPLTVLAGAVALLLVVSAANIAILFIARSGARRQELAVRVTLGARRWQLVRRLLTEVLLLSAVGAALGLLAAVYGNRLLVAAIPFDLPSYFRIGLDPAVLVFVLVLALVTALTAGFGPALASAQRSRAGLLAEEGGRATLGRRGQRARRLLVVGEIALTTLLLVSAALLVQSVRHTLGVDRGFATGSLLTAGLSLPGETYPAGEAAERFYQRLVERVGSLPEVESVAAARHLPSGAGGSSRPFRVRGVTGVEETALPTANYQVISPGYFRTLGMPVIEGRAFDERDGAGEPAVVVSRFLADRFWEPGRAVGSTLEVVHGDGERRYRVVGVVGDVRLYDIDRPAGLDLYVPLVGSGETSMRLLLRHRPGATGVAAALRQEIAALDPAMEPFSVASLRSVISRSAYIRRLSAIMIGLFAALALVQAAVGLFGVVSESVSRRRRELGIRMAVGAGRGRLLSMLLVQGMWMAVAGLVLGMVASLLATRILGNLLFGLQASDPATYLVVAGLLLVVTLLAVYLPVRRGRSLDPAGALRYE